MVNENKIRILYVQPGKHPEERFAMNELHPLQQLVGGDIQAVYPWSKDNVALICNDSGKVDGLPLNRCIEDYDVIAGNFFICGFSGEEFCSLTDKQLSAISGWCARLRNSGSTYDSPDSTTSPRNTANSAEPHNADSHQ